MLLLFHNVFQVATATWSMLWENYNTTSSPIVSFTRRSNGNMYAVAFAGITFESFFDNISLQLLIDRPVHKK